MAEANNPSREIKREGFLFKRQRGKKISRESQRKKLKFQKRYCILTSTGFIYKLKKETTATKGTPLPVDSLKVVEEVKAKTFRKQNCDFCFQVGEQNDMIYLVAKDATEKINWMNDFRKVAKQNQNVMSEFYHPGAYGSMRKEKWSCCERAGKTAKGCKPFSKSGNRQKEIAKSFNEANTRTSTSTSPVKQPRKSLSLPRQGLEPIETDNSFMTTSGESNYNSDSSDCISVAGEELSSHYSKPQIIIEHPTDGNPNEDKMSSRSRTNTHKSESGADTGIDTDHGHWLNSNTSCRSVLSQSRSVNAELDKVGHEDEGICRDSQASEYSTRTLTAKSSSLASVSHIAVEINANTNCSRTSTDSTALDAVEEEENTGANINMCESYVLSQPISAVTLIDSEKKIVTGTVDGMVRIWAASLENQNRAEWIPVLKLTKSLRVAGEVSSIDVYDNYLLVGSTLAQVIDLSNPELPRKAFVADQKNLFSTSQKKNLVAFARRGDEVMVVSGTIGGDKINVWKLPSWEDKMPFVLKPDLSFNIDGPIERISCTSSAPNNGSWVGVVSVDHNREKASVTLHLLNLLTASQHRCDVTFEEQISDKVCVTFLHSGRKIAIGSSSELQVWETDTGRYRLQSLTLRDSIMSIYYSEASSGYLAVGLENGDVDIMVHKEEQYTQISTFSLELEVACTVPMPAVALSFDEKFTWGVVVHPNGSLEVWQAAQENEAALPARVTNHPTLGMELENEGLISQLEILHYSPESGQGIVSSGSEMQMEDHIEFGILKEVCENDGIFAVEAGAVVTSPLSPFIFPKELSSSAHIASPIVWLCSVPQRRFSKQVKLKIPHCVRTDSDTKGHSGLRLLKADHTNVRLNKLGQRVIVFEDVTSKYAGRLTYNCDTLSVTVKDDHFCFYCLFVADFIWSDFLKSVEFCLTIFVPIEPDNQRCYSIYCILHYNLHTCKQLIHEQFDEGKYEELNPEIFSFGNPDSAVFSVEADVQEAERKGWQVGFDSPQEILARKVNILDTYKDTERLPQLYYDCVEKTYPPRFVIRVAPQNARDFSHITLTFRGANRVINRDILLVLTPDRHPDPPRPEDVPPFREQANGSQPHYDESDDK